MDKWDNYFHSHYKPVKGDWSGEDLKMYMQWYSSWINYILPLLPRKKGNLLELGSAVGSTAVLLSKSGFRVTGSDISQEMVHKAEQLCKPIRFVYCDIQKGISHRGWDAIAGFEVLEHVPNLKKAVGNIYKSLKKGGIFFGSSPYPYQKNFLDPTHCNVHSPDEWKKIFKKTGFVSVKTYPMSFFPFFWRIHRLFNPVLPFYVPLPWFISTTLIVAEK